MTPAKGPVQTDVDEVARIEGDLEAARHRAGMAIRTAREAKSISLRQAATQLRLSPGALSELERGRSWRTKTALRVARFIDRHDQVA